MKSIVLDTEADGLIPTKVWCAVAMEWPTGETFRFREEECYTELPRFLDNYDKVIGHNIVGYERHRIFPLLGIDMPLERCVDTLLLSQLANPMRRDGYGGHALEAWGWRLGHHKPEHNEWDKFSEAMLIRCEEDVAITKKLFKVLLKELDGFSTESSRLEHRLRVFLDRMKDNGFYLDYDKAVALHHTISSEIRKLEATLSTEVPPLVKPGDIVTRRLTKSGTVVKSNQRRIQSWLDTNEKLGWPRMGLDEVVGGDYQLVEFQPFDVGSPDRVVRAMDRYGWKPYRKTKSKKSWQVCEENLATLPDTAPEIAQQIPRLLSAKARAKLLEGWFDNYRRYDDGCIHGSVLGMGAYTHRASHMDPNMANVPGNQSPVYGIECRQLLTVRDPGNYRLLGCDAQGIQLRVLAHLTGSKEYAESVLDDPHSANMHALGIPLEGWDEDSQTYRTSRAKAKTFIYAWLLGAGPALISHILKCSVKDAKGYIESFIANTPGMSKLKRYLGDAAERGWLPLVDGRRARIPTEFLAMAVALQGNEAVIMKRALVDWQDQIDEKKMDAWAVAWVHDELQAVVHKDQAEEAGEMMNECIRQAGRIYKTKCPMDGEYKIGLTWADTH